MRRQPLWGSVGKAGFRSGELSTCSVASPSAAGDGASIPEPERGEMADFAGPRADLKPAQRGRFLPGWPFPSGTEECRLEMVLLLWGLGCSPLET